MLDIFENNERKTNKLLINVNWIAVILSYSILYIMKILNKNDISYSFLILGFITTVLLFGISEIWYRYGIIKIEAKKSLKYYLMGETAAAIFLVMIISGNPYLLGVYFYPIIAAVLYYHTRLIVVSVVLSLASITILVSNNLINIYAPEVSSKGMFFVDILGSLLICIFLLTGYSRKSKNIIKAIKKQEEALLELNQSLESRVERRTKELQEAVEELNAQQQDMIALNESLIKANNEVEQVCYNLKETQTQLVQHEKMASLGMLVAGVVHEVNNPIGAIVCNIDLTKILLDYMKKHHNVVEDNNLSSWVEKLNNANQTSLLACNKIIEIVKSLKNFARLDEADYQEADIHVGINNTLTLLSYRLKDKVKIRKEFQKLPRIMCYPNELNQVFMNLIVNAVEAIKDDGEIYIKTFTDGTNIYVSISDNGAGIKHEYLNKIFDPGFTTKGTGVGKGLGLPICYNIIEKHSGAIYVDTEESVGTTFILQIPIKPEREEDN